MCIGISEMILIPEPEQINDPSWFQKTFERRLAECDKIAPVMIMSRLHHEDKIGVVELMGEWDHIKLPVPKDGL